MLLKQSTHRDRMGAALARKAVRCSPIDDIENACAALPGHVAPNHGFACFTEAECIVTGGHFDLDVAMASPQTSFTEQDLRDAVRDGAVPESAVDAFRSYMASRSTRVDEEEFHLFRGFNDVFVALASVLLFTGITWFTADLGVVATCLLVMAVAAALSEYFTLRKRLALSSIVYVLAFSIAAAARRIPGGLAG